LKKYFIAGGAGFICSNFVHFLTKKNPQAEILVFDKLTYAGMQENLENLKIKFFCGDLAEKKQLEKIFTNFKPDFVINFAAETHVDRSILGPEIFVRTNIFGTQNLLETSRQCGIKKYLQVSTDEVYGDLGDNSKNFFTEFTPLKPNCPYAASKAGADLLVRSYFETYDFPAVISRCTNNYGPRQFPEKLIPFFIFRALQNLDLPIYGDGKNIRDWLFVDDHCRAIFKILENGKNGEVYNVGGNNEKTNLEITEILLQKLGKSSSLIKFVPDRLAHDRRYAMDNSKIRQELNWEPKFPFEIWIEKTIEWYLQNQNWVQKANQKLDQN